MEETHSGGRGSEEMSALRARLLPGQMFLCNINVFNFGGIITRSVSEEMVFLAYASGWCAANFPQGHLAARQEPRPPVVALL